MRRLSLTRKGHEKGEVRSEIPPGPEVREGNGKSWEKDKGRLSEGRRSVKGPACSEGFSWKTHCTVAHRLSKVASTLKRAAHNTSWLLGFVSLGGHCHF